MSVCISTPFPCFYFPWSGVADAEWLPLESSEFELATGVLQKAADYKSCLQDLVPTLPKEEVDECNCLEVEYFIMRTALVGRRQIGKDTGIISRLTSRSLSPGQITASMLPNTCTQKQSVFANT